MPNIGYIINESGILMEDFDIIDSPSLSSSSNRRDEIKFHSKDRVIGFGSLQTAEEKNRNGRIYRRSDLVREINAPRQRELLNAGQLCGHSGHPIGPGSESLVVQQTIKPELCCVRFHTLWMDGNNVMAYFEGTNNELGEAFDKDLRIGIKPAFSLRALGSIKATPQGAVVENLKMITYDYVIYPSHPHAYTSGVITESSNISTTSNFDVNNGMDATKSFIKEFTSNEVKIAMDQIKNESAINYIKDKSWNYKMLRECYDMNKFDTVDIIGNNKIAITEAGNATIIMNVEDYIAREIQNYR